MERKAAQLEQLPADDRPDPGPVRGAREPVGEPDEGVAAAGDRPAQSLGRVGGERGHAFAP